MAAPTLAAPVARLAAELAGLPGVVAVVLAGIVLWDLRRRGEDLGEQAVARRL